MYVMYVLLGNGAPVFTNDALANELKDYFQKSPGFSLKFEQLPFREDKTLALFWGSWLTRVAYEEGDDVMEDSAEINRVVGLSAPYDLSRINKRIRIVCSDDDSRDYTNQIIRLMEFALKIPGAVVYDPQQKKLLDNE